MCKVVLPPLAAGRRTLMAGKCVAMEFSGSQGGLCALKKYHQGNQGGLGTGSAGNRPASPPLAVQGWTPAGVCVSRHHLRIPSLSETLSRTLSANAGSTTFPTKGTPVKEALDRYRQDAGAPSRFASVRDRGGPIPMRADCQSLKNPYLLRPCRTGPRFFSPQWASCS